MVKPVGRIQTAAALRRGCSAERERQLDWIGSGRQAERSHPRTRGYIVEHRRERLAAFYEKRHALVSPRLRLRNRVPYQASVRERRREHIVVFDTHAATYRVQIVSRQ
jgi:hypothetical protein